MCGVKCVCPWSTPIPALYHPGDWKRMPEFDRLLIFRTLRPDRLTAAMARFVANTLGEQYITSQPFDLERSFQASLQSQG